MSNKLKQRLQAITIAILIALFLIWGYGVRSETNAKKDAIYHEMKEQRYELGAERQTGKLIEIEER